MYPEDQQPRNYSDEEIDTYRKSQKNNSLPEHHKYAKAVLIFSFFLLISIVIGLSYFLTNKEENKSENNLFNTPSVALDQAQSEAESEKPRMSAGWLEYKSGEYDIKIPDGWDTVHQDNGVLLMSCDSNPGCYKLTTGTLATVEETIGGRGGLQGFLFTIQPEGTISDYVTGYSLVMEIVDGYSLYEREVTEDPDGEFIGGDMPIGTKEYLALKTLDDGRISYFSYSVVPAQTSPANLVEEMITTLIIN